MLMKLTFNVTGDRLNVVAIYTRYSYTLKLITKLYNY
jgi:hypothetical protein